MNKKLRYGYVLSALILLAPAFPRAARANQITDFNVSGTTQNQTNGTLGTCGPSSTCNFSGTMTVDTTTGHITALDVTFPGLASFTSLASQNASSTSWFVSGGNSTSDGLYLYFSTSPNAASLLAFTGGKINSTHSTIINSAGETHYFPLTGSISPVVPEPGNLALLAADLLGLGFVVRRRKRRAAPLA